MRKLAYAFIGSALLLGGCSGGDQVQGNDSMEKTLLDAQKKAPAGEAKPWTDKSAGAKTSTPPANAPSTAGGDATH